MQNILNRLHDNDIKLSLLLLELKDLADRHGEHDVSKYLDLEINGYKKEDKLPEYRIIKGQIVCDIRDIYGSLIHEQHPVDFSGNYREVGINVDETYIPDDIAFVETSLSSLTKQTSIRPIPNIMVRKLDEVFHYNNQSLHLTAAYHKLPTASLGYILTKVRQNLIQMVRKSNMHLQKPNSDIQAHPIVSSVPTSHKKKSVFVTYAWGDQEHNDKVISFVDFLRKSGFDASMDRKSTQEESSINLNQMMVEGIQNNDKVIVVLSSKYKEKADKFEGGVGQEINMILEDMKIRKNKYIFLFFYGEDRKTVTPTAISGREAIDLKKDQDDGFNLLFSKIKEENTIEFSDVQEDEVVINKVEIKPFKL